MQFNDPEVQSSLSMWLRSHYEGHFHLDQLTTGSFFGTLSQSIQEVLDPDKNFPRVGLLVVRGQWAAESERVEIWHARREINRFLRQNPYVNEERFKQSLRRYDLNYLYDLQRKIGKLSELWSEEIENVNAAILAVILEIIRIQHDEKETRRLEKPIDEQKRQEEVGQAQAQFRLWQEKISSRCRQIVSVFNGIFNFAIDSDAVFSGEIDGEYASINSVGSSGSRIGLYQELRQAIEMRYCTGDERTWLEIQEGGNATEWQATYDSENFLIWHELAHLADPNVIKSCIDYVVSAEADDSYIKVDQEGIILVNFDLFKRQAKEVVIDAIAIGLGETFYVHSDKVRFLRTERDRKRAMHHSHLALAKRIFSSCFDPSELIEQMFLVARLLAELKIHYREKTEKFEVGHDKELTEFYHKLYRKALQIDVLKIGFRQSLIKDTQKDEESESLVGAKVVNLRG